MITTVLYYFGPEIFMQVSEYFSDLSKGIISTPNFNFDIESTWKDIIELPLTKINIDSPIEILKIAIVTIEQIPAIDIIWYNISELKNISYDKEGLLNEIISKTIKWFEYKEIKNNNQFIPFLFKFLLVNTSTCKILNNIFSNDIIIHQINSMKYSIYFQEFEMDLSRTLDTLSYNENSPKDFPHIMKFTSKIINVLVKNIQNYSTNIILNPLYKPIVIIVKKIDSINQYLLKLDVSSKHITLLLATFLIIISICTQLPSLDLICYIDIELILQVSRIFLNYVICNKIDRIKTLLVTAAKNFIEEVYT